MGSSLIERGNESMIGYIGRFLMWIGVMGVSDDGPHFKWPWQKWEEN
jgi:hypothetical protein